MKRTICVIICAIACNIHAAPPLAITNYYPGTVITTNTFADAGDTGLTVSNAYICIPVAAITNTEYTAALVTNDVRPYISAMILKLQQSIAAQSVSNRFTTFSVSADVQYPSPTNRIVYRAISEQQAITITPVYPAQ